MERLKRSFSIYILTGFCVNGKQPQIEGVSHYAKPTGWKQENYMYDRGAKKLQPERGVPLTFQAKV